MCSPFINVIFNNTVDLILCSIHLKNFCYESVFSLVCQYFVVCIIKLISAHPCDISCNIFLYSESLSVILRIFFSLVFSYQVWSCDLWAWLLVSSDCLISKYIMTWSFPYSSLFLSGEIDESEMSFCFTGIFQIVAVNEISQTSSFWQFVVHSPPVILKNLNKKIESKEDDTVTFDIKVQGDPKPEVKWWVEWGSWF